MKNALKEKFIEYANQHDYTPFVRLLNNIHKKFPEHDPVLVLSDSVPISYHRDRAREGKCICSKGKLLHVYTVCFDGISYCLGSECINALSILEDLTEDLVEDELTTINKLLIFYKTVKALHKKKCINYEKCNKKVDIRKNYDCPEIYLNYCNTCAINDDIHTCQKCNDTIEYDGKTLICKLCYLAEKGKKYCNFHNCRNVVDRKYNYCFNHYNKVNTKICSTENCNKKINQKYSYCYNCSYDKIFD
jgi:hypothetical protein